MGKLEIALLNATVCITLLICGYVIAISLINILSTITYC